MPAIADILSSLEKEHRLRTIPEFNNKGTIDLSSNDYLSLGSHCHEFKEEFMDRFGDADFSSSASRLLSTKQKYHAQLEAFLEQLYGKPSLLFNSGYHANVGCIGALTLPSTLFVCDKLIHASIVDGLKISGSEFKRFHHNDIIKLRKILEASALNYERIIIVVESIYSMDGDEAPLTELVKLKKEFPNVLLYVDEAHAFGVRGTRGLGITEEKRIINDIDIIIGTFGKAAASAGAFAVCSTEMKSLLINTARPFIFSTALPPVNIAWSLMMTEKIIEMSAARQQLISLSRQFSHRLEEISGKPTGSTSQIIGYLTGNAEAAISLGNILRENGFLAMPIRRPTVPPGGERIRFSLSADLDISLLEPLFNILSHNPLCDDLRVYFPK
ncbi:MAG: aminotransferase class I/II-fold pyridoxal phosphate-dependent enzyme [Bacteroides sp.]|nr:aminotransferase class I/II-fold pyridoxal phosphate-dependent enzyme [Bacteroides sp.]